MKTLWVRRDSANVTKGEFYTWQMLIWLILAASFSVGDEISRDNYFVLALVVSAGFMIALLVSRIRSRKGEPSA